MPRQSGSRSRHKTPNAESSGDHGKFCILGRTFNIQVQLTSLRTLKSYIWEFNSRKPQPLSYSRACLANLVFGNPNEMYEELLRKELEELVMPKDAVLDPVNWSFESSQNPLVPTDRRAVMASLVNDFTNRTAQVGSALPLQAGHSDVYRTILKS